MKPEMLESLVIDRALDSVPLAVAELLDEYLAANPEAARRADEVTATLRLARAAVVPSLGKPSRPLDRGRIGRAAQARRLASLAPELARLAACVALGLVLGWWARPAQAPILEAAASRSEQPSQFWSLSSWEADQAGPHHSALLRRAHSRAAADSHAGGGEPKGNR